ncbi:MAG: dephospho-CoA kinase [Bacteroidetes bacterium]|nr:dephospho-CoA kinase [Bacteroidota bacterium]
MLRAALTGNIGSGKSVVASVFSSLGIPVFHADEESKNILKLPEVIDEIAGLFGKEVVVNGMIDNKRLASVVFGNSQALNRLSGLLHPLVLKDFNSWLQAWAGEPYVIMESAILFESGYAKEFDRIIHVSCPEDTAIERVVKRDGLERGLVLDRMSHQLKNDDKARMSDFVIINDGSLLLIPQVIAIHKKLLQGCA